MRFTLQTKESSMLRDFRTLSVHDVSYDTPIKLTLFENGLHILGIKILTLSKNSRLDIVVTEYVKNSYSIYSRKRLVKEHMELFMSIEDFKKYPQLSYNDFVEKFLEVDNFVEEVLTDVKSYHLFNDVLYTVEYEKRGFICDLVKERGDKLFETYPILEELKGIIENTDNDSVEAVFEKLKKVLIPYA